MQGVVQVGTARGIWSYDLPAGLEIAGKTGTTNENSDAWFMGYTPQLLAGTWVGADDRFIRFSNENLNGQGARAAMPIWAYFFAKAAADPNCGIDVNQTFVKPETMPNDILIDYINGTAAPLGAEGEDQGNGTVTDYSVPKDIKPEDIKAESDPLEDTKKTTIKPIDNKDKTVPKPLDGKPAITPPAVIKPVDKGKAVMPPPIKKTGTGNN